MAVWEQSLHSPPLERALNLLACACAEPVETLAALSVGERDGRLMRLREWAFGSQVQSVVACLHCAEQVEFDFDLGTLRAALPIAQPAPLLVSCDDLVFHLRLPNSYDLLALGQQPEVSLARQQLVERCIVRVEPADLPVNGLSEERLAVLEAALARADPQAELELSLACPTCGHCWTVLFDIGAFFWSEIEVWGLRTLYDIHRLAMAYGWSEAAILHLSPWRRQRYLELLADERFSH
jgi:hypothetical protein